MRLIVVLVLIGILASLGSALFYLTKSGGTGDRNMVKALTWRIGLSVALFLFLIFSYWMGWVRPHAIGG